MKTKLKYIQHYKVDPQTPSIMLFHWYKKRLAEERREKRRTGR